MKRLMMVMLTMMLTIMTIKTMMMMTMIDGEEEEDDNDEKVDFKELLLEHRALSAPGTASTLACRQPNKDCIWLLRWGVVGGGCLFDQQLSGRRWIWIKGFIRQQPRLGLQS